MPKSHELLISLGGDASQLNEEIKRALSNVANQTAVIGLSIDGKDVTKQFQDMWDNINKQVKKNHIDLGDLIDFGDFVAKLDNTDKSILTIQQSMRLMVEIARQLGSVQLGDAFAPLIQKVDDLLGKIDLVIDRLQGISTQAGNATKPLKSFADVEERSAKAARESAQAHEELAKALDKVNSTSRTNTAQEVLDKDYEAPNDSKLYAKRQLKDAAYSYQDIYGDLDQTDEIIKAQRSEAGAAAGYAFIKAYQEALRTGASYAAEYDDIMESFLGENVDDETLQANLISYENILKDYAEIYRQTMSQIGSIPVTDEFNRQVNEIVTQRDILRNQAQEVESGSDLFNTEDLQTQQQYISLLEASLQSYATEYKAAYDQIQKETAEATQQAKEYAQVQDTVDALQPDQISSTNIQPSSAPLGTTQEDVNQLIQLLQRLGDELSLIRKSIGSVDDENGFTPLLSSIQEINTFLNDTTSELRELMQTFSGINFNVTLNSGKNANPVQQMANYGRKARETVVELQKAFNELNDIVVGEQTSIFKKSTDGLPDASHLMAPYVDLISSLGSKQSLAGQISTYEELIKILKEAASIKITDPTQQEAIAKWSEQYEASTQQAVDATQKMLNGEQEAETATKKLLDLFGKADNVNFDGMIKQLDTIIEKLQQISDLLSQGLSFNLAANRVSSNPNITLPEPTIIDNDLQTEVKDLAPDSEEWSNTIDQVEKLEAAIGRIVKITKTQQQTADGVLTTYQLIDELGNRMFFDQDGNMLRSQNTVYNSAQVSKQEYATLMQLMRQEYTLRKEINTLAAGDNKTTAENRLAEIQNQILEQKQKILSENLTLEQEELRVQQLETQLSEQYNASVRRQQSRAASTSALNTLLNTVTNYQRKDAYQLDLDNFITNSNQIETTRNKIRDIFDELNKGSQVSTQRLQELRQEFRTVSSELDRLATTANLRTNKQGTLVDGLEGITDGRTMADLTDQLRMYATTVGDLQGFSLGSGFKDASADIRTATGEIQKLVFSFDELGNVRVKVADTSAQVNVLGNAVEAAGHKVEDMMKYWMSIYQVWAQLQRGITYITDLNTAITNHVIVTGEATGSLREMGAAAREVANEVAGLTVDIQNSATDWAALGYTAAESMDLARQAAIYARVGFIDVDSATTSLTSSLQAFKDTLDTDDIGTAAEEIVDKYVLVANRFAVTSSELGEGLQRSAAALVAAGNDINESIALTTAGNTILQDSNAMSNALKVVSMRLRGTDASELEAAGEDIDGVVESASKLYDIVKNLTKTESNPEGVSILTDTGAYKSTYDILLEIAEVWEEIDDMSQAALLETIAGKQRGSAVAALLQNPDLIREVYEASLDASGSSAEALEVALGSIEAHITRLQNTFQALWQNALNDDVIIMFVDLANAILKVADNVGLLQTAFFGLGAYMGAKNIGRIKMLIFIKYADRNKCSLGY